MCDYYHTNLYIIIMYIYSVLIIIIMYKSNYSI